jgi:hypothetical protein
MANIAIHGGEVHRATSLLTRNGVSVRSVKLRAAALLLGAAVVVGGVAAGAVDTDSPAPAAVVLSR